MHVFDEMRNCVICKEDSVQIWKAHYGPKHHQLAPTLGLVVPAEA